VLVRFALTSLLAVLALTVVVVWMTARWNSPLNIDVDSLGALLAWSTYFLALVTLGLLVAAVTAGLRIGEQIRQDRAHHQEMLELQRKHHDEQLTALTRPLIAIAATRRARTGEPTLEVDVENLGLGPAQKIDILAWPRSLPDGLSASEARDRMDEARRAVNLEAPELRLRLGGLTASGRVSELLSATTTSPAVGPDLVDFLVYLATYADALGNQFPTKPRAEWEAGHVLLQRRSQRQVGPRPPDPRRSAWLPRLRARLRDRVR